MKMTENLPQVSTVFFPILTEHHDIIQVRTGKLLAVSDYMSDHSLEHHWSTVKTKGMTSSSNKPNGVVNAVLSQDLGSIGICQ